MEKILEEAKHLRRTAESGHSRTKRLRKKKTDDENVMKVSIHAHPESDSHLTHPKQATCARAHQKAHGA